MFTVFVTLKVREGQLDAFVKGIHSNVQASLRDEPGCLRFDVHRSSDEPGRFFFYEIYRDRVAFEVLHRNAPHYQDWRAIVDNCVEPGTQVIATALPEFPLEFQL